MGRVQGYKEGATRSKKEKEKMVVGVLGFLVVGTGISIGFFSNVKKRENQRDVLFFSLCKARKSPIMHITMELDGCCCWNRLWKKCPQYKKKTTMQKMREEAGLCL